MSRAMAWCLLLLLCGCTDDVLDASYADVGEAVADGAIARGWIPGWIPPGAINLREVHDIDTNESALVFELPEGPRWTPPASECERAVGQTYHAPKFDRAWLPDVSEDFTLYDCGETGSPGSTPANIMVAISVDGRRVLHWRRLPP